MKKQEKEKQQDAGAGIAIDHTAKNRIKLAGYSKKQETSTDKTKTRDETAVEFVPKTREPLPKHSGNVESYADWVKFQTELSCFHVE